jgi:hypothetical protein
MPVLRKTSSEGRARHLIPKTSQDRGKAGSQLTLKKAHLRQSGARFPPEDILSWSVSLGAMITSFLCGQRPYR